jgi:BASS family bile acid:Na+ symporter
MEQVTVEQVILMLLEVALFTSVLTLGFVATKYEPFALFRRPSLLIRTFLSMYIVVPVVTAVILALVPLPVGVKTGVILLAVSPVALTSRHSMLALGANPGYVYSLLISMSLISVVMVPISLAILTALPLAHDAIAPPFEVAKLIAQDVVMPLIIGSIIRRLAPRWAERLGRPANAVLGKVTMAALLALLVLNLVGIAEAGVLSFIVLGALTAVGLAAGHLLGGPALVERAALAIASTQRQMAIATLIAAINFPGAVTINVIVMYLFITMLVTTLYTKWCKKQLAKQAET